MKRKTRLELLLLLCCCYFNKLQALTNDGYLNQLRHYELVEPSRVDEHGGRTRRAISNTEQHTDDELKFFFKGHNRDFHIKLTKNRLLIPPMFTTYTQNQDGSRKLDPNMAIKNCYYHGELENRKNSMAALSTCNGLRGFIQDEDEEEFFIEPHHDNNHILYNMKDLMISQNNTCGHVTSSRDQDHHHAHHQYKTLKNKLQEELQKRSRRRRNAKNWNYIETVAVIDKREYTKLGSKEASQARAVELFNFIDAIYKTINTRVTLVSVIIWNTKDEIQVTSSTDSTLSQFQNYTSSIIHDQMKLNADNAQLITAVDFTGDTVGYAGVGDICTKRSCGINMDYSRNIAVTSNTIAHELGHNLGFLHTTDACTCSSPPCVMAPRAANSHAQGFSSCSKEIFKEKEEEGNYACLLDYPTVRFGSIKCGDGYKEGIEECDCGTPEECRANGGDRCCNPNTCRLQNGARCADGACCENCQFKTKGTQCRGKVNNDCDLEEYCTGTSNQCPRNFYVSDGKSCGNDEGYCYEGLCRTHVQQCENIWGLNSTKARDRCFGLNTEGTDFANCGTNENGNNIPCSSKNSICGKIQCQAKPGKTMPKFPIIGSSARILTTTFTPPTGDQYKCITSKIEFSSEIDDPTLTLDGTKCGDNSICLNQQCTSLSTITTNSCNNKCKNGGVCNNNGNCHCPAGFACPFCEQPGVGGSLDSGQGCHSQLTSKPPPTTTTTTRTTTTTTTTRKPTTSTTTTTTTTRKPSASSTIKQTPPTITSPTIKPTTGPKSLKPTAPETTVITDDVTTVNTTPNNDTTEGEQTNTIMYVALAGIIVLALIIIVVVICCCKRKKNEKYSDSRHPERFASAVYTIGKGRENMAYETNKDAWTKPTQVAATQSHQPHQFLNTYNPDPPINYPLKPTAPPKPVTPFKPLRSAQNSASPTNYQQSPVKPPVAEKPPLRTKPPVSVRPAKPKLPTPSERIQPGIPMRPPIRPLTEPVKTASSNHNRPAMLPPSYRNVPKYR